MHRQAGFMHRRAGITTIACLAMAMLVLPSGASALTKVVYAGAPKAQTQTLAAKLLGKGAKGFKTKYRPAFLAFLNQTVTVNQGDTVMWAGLSGFHTVDLPGKSGQDLPLFVRGKTVTGVDDFTGNPFWFDGVKPSAEFNPQLNASIGGRTYNGTARVDSGAPGPDTFKVTFTKPGVYRYFCDVHPGMVGHVVVRAKGKPIPAAQQDAASLTKQLRTDILSLKKLASTRVPADHVSLGASGANGAELLHFFPATLSVKAGTVVTFSIPSGSRIEGHTASFGPAGYLTALSNSSSDAATQQTVYPSSNPALGPIQLGRISHGNGFANTGWLDRDPAAPFPSSQKIKFRTPGTYHFICLIHSFMTGTIVVH
jgi:plastocyanin